MDQIKQEINCQFCSRSVFFNTYATGEKMVSVMSRREHVVLSDSFDVITIILLYLYTSTVRSFETEVSVFIQTNIRNATNNFVSKKVLK